MPDTFIWEPSYAIDEGIEFITKISEGEKGKERRRSKRNGKRRFTAVFNRPTVALCDALWNFYIAQKGAYQAFYWTPPVRNVWAASTIYGEGSYVLKVVDNGYRYECTTAGTSAGTEPTWPTTPGNTVADGTCVWTCRIKALTVRFERDDLSRSYFTFNRYSLSLGFVEVPD